MHAAVARECRAVREAVGLLDASTLGKIDIQGPDAREFLNRVYTNAWTKLDVGKARYGLMCKEDGMVFDDGVTACLADNHFVMTTTTGGAARVLEWLELYHQTEWPELKVYFTSVTDHYATLTLSGPNSRKLLAEVTDIDLDKDAFPFMTWKEGKVAGVPARVFRISFTGELSYEVNVQADYAMGVLEALAEHGAKYGLTPYGTETMHVLRAEKGFIIVGQDTDASVTPDDLNMGWAVGRNKPFSWIGWRGMNADRLREDRKQLVGLRPSNPQEVLPEGAQLVFDTQQAIPMKMVGHVTSSYMSASLGHGFALAVVKGGLKRMGQKVYAPLADGRFARRRSAPRCSTTPKGAAERGLTGGMRSSPALFRRRRQIPGARRPKVKTSKANVYQQRPEPGVHAESPLHHAELHKLAARPPRRPVSSCARRSCSATWCCAAMPPTRPSPPPCTRPSAWNCRWPLTWSPAARPRCNGWPRTNGC